MNKYEILKESTLSKIREILDAAKPSKKIEILVEMEVGSSPVISYKIYDYRILPEAED